MNKNFPTHDLELAAVIFASDLMGKYWVLIIGIWLQNCTLSVYFWLIVKIKMVKTGGSGCGWHEEMVEGNGGRSGCTAWDASQGRIPYDSTRFLFLFFFL